MKRRPPRSTRTATLFPYTTLFRSNISSSIGEAAERFGGIGTVVFAGGVPIGQPFVSKIDESDWREVIETELIGFTRVVAATLPVFRQQGSGNFGCVVSVALYRYPDLKRVVECKCVSLRVYLGGG